MATGETIIDESSENPMPVPIYEPAEMSDTEIETKMNENGYEKDVEEEKVEYTEITTYITDMDGGNRENSKDRTSETVTPIDYRYVKKGNDLKFEINTTYLMTKDRLTAGTFMIEKGIERREYLYGKESKSGGPNTAKKVEIGKLVFDFISGAFSGKKK